MAVPSGGRVFIDMATKPKIPQKAGYQLSDYKLPKKKLFRLVNDRNITKTLLSIRNQTIQRYTKTNRNSAVILEYDRHFTYTVT